MHYLNLVALSSQRSVLIGTFIHTELNRISNAIDLAL